MSESGLRMPPKKPDGGRRQDIFDNPESKLRYEAYRSDYLRYEAYSRLQAAAVAFGESLPIPEIVAIGGQSDGKSSLLEAFLGFRFNVREVEMGTRRPLIVQMVHDPTAQEPRCRLQNEDDDEYGPPIIPETAVADMIMKRTEDHLRRLGGAVVSAKAIVMRAEYAYCPNLTIVDTPGFILKAKAGEADNTPEEIMQMVKAQAQPAHRLILFLQQSSVEWASSLWLRTVQEVDPHMMRTVVVASKFDNRLKEFAERWEVDKYLSATGYLPPHVKPFFVALPKDRAIQSSAEWRRAMAEVDAHIYRHLRENVKGGFDEERFAARLGFGALKRFLEEELARRYREAAPGTLALLQERCDAVATELRAAEARLRSAEDVASLRRAAMKYAASMSSQVSLLLNGSVEPEPQQHGMTTDEERMASRSPQWPGIAVSVKPQNNALRLFGGAAFERCLAEFQEAAQALKFPSVARDKVANVLLAYRGKNNLGGPARAAEDIARETARDLLGPLLDCACSRLSFVIRRVFDIAADRAMGKTNGRDNLQPYVAFHAALRAAHQNFVNKLEGQAKEMVHHHLAAATSEFALTLMAQMPDLLINDDNGEDDEQPSPSHQEDEAHTGGRHTSGELHEAGHRDVTRLAAQAHHAHNGNGGPGRFVEDSPSKGRLGKTHRVDNSTARASAALEGGKGTYEDVIAYAERLFAKIRTAVACQNAPATLKNAFLDPMADQLATDVSIELFAKSDAEFMTMFTAAGAMAALQAKRDSLARRVEGLIKCKNEFQELAKCL